MGFPFYLLMAICAISAFFIIITVMMQPSKDGGLGGLGGGGGVTDSVLGANRNTVLSKATWFLMILFLGSSIILGMITSRTIKEKADEKTAPSLLEKALEEEKKEETPTVPTADTKEAPVAAPTEAPETK